MPCIQLLIATRDANNTYSASAVLKTPYQLTRKKATSTAGRQQAIEALLAKATPPLKLFRMAGEFDVPNADGSRSGVIHHFVEIQES